MDSSVHNNNKRQKTTHDNDDKKIKTKCKTKLVYFSDFLFFSQALGSLVLRGPSELTVNHSLAQLMTGVKRLAVRR